MANQYETFRETIIATIRETCIKQKDGSESVAYNWSIGRVFDACGKACGIEGKLPSDLKAIISFEFNKVKDSTMSNDGWNALKTSSRYVYANDGIEKRRTDTYGNNALPLAEQLKGAQDLLSKAQTSLAKSGNEETTKKVNKRIKRLLGEIDFLKKEIDHQATLAQQANAAGQVTSTANV